MIRICKWKEKLKLRHLRFKLSILTYRVAMWIWAKRNVSGLHVVSRVLTNEWEERIAERTMGKKKRERETEKRKRISN